MLADSLIVPQCIYRPGSFSGLMTIYESNFLKFDRLCGHAQLGPELHVSHVTDDCDLHLEIVRQEPYTSTLTLTYWFEESDRAGALHTIPDPDLLVRVYHDAALVEAVTSRERHRHRVLEAISKSHSGELDRRWRINMMLNKWLDYLLDKGHKFGG